MRELGNTYTKEEREALTARSKELREAAQSKSGDILKK